MPTPVVSKSSVGLFNVGCAPQDLVQRLVPRTFLTRLVSTGLCRLVVDMTIFAMGAILKKG